MPYAVVETTAIGNGKKTVVVPETWVISKNDRIGFVYWPNEPCKIGELIADDHSSPSPLWEKHLCKIIFRTIPTLASAEKALAIWQKQFNAQAKNATPAKGGNANAAPSGNTTPAQNKDSFQGLPVRKLPTKPIEKATEPSEKPPFARRNDLFGGFFTVHSEGMLGGENSPYLAQGLSPQLCDLLNELKREIVGNQEKMLLKMQEGFTEMRKLFASLIRPNGQFELRNDGHSLKTPDGTYKFQKLMTINDVKQFEAQLASVNFRKNVYTWIDSVIWHEQITAKRMKTIVELMFDDKLLAQFSWFGTHNKEPLKQYLNIRNLLEYITTTPTHQSNQDEVKYLFLKMMNHETSKATTVKQKSADSLAHDDLQRQEPPSAPTEKLSVEKGHVAKQNAIVDGSGPIELDIIVEDGEAMEFEEIVEHEEILQPEETITEKDNSELEKEQPARKRDESLEEININRITCLEELDLLENELKDPEMQREVHKWIDKAVVKRETVVEKRLITLLDRLMDSNVLQSLSWMNAKSDKRPLEKCKNFVRLFEHASRTVIHQTIIYNHRLVANFFAKRIGES